MTHVFFAIDDTLIAVRNRLWEVHQQLYLGYNYRTFGTRLETMRMNGIVAQPDCLLPQEHEAV